jgi:hypothetical protein
MRIKLVGKTNKAKNRLREAGTQYWRIQETAQEVAFSQRQGPWHFIRPDSSIDKRDHSRWVSESDDPDFSIIFEKD